MYLDFYKLLSENEPEYGEEEDLCMITKTPLTKTHIKLDCTHKFNYLPLLKDMYTRIYSSHQVKCLSGFPLHVNKIKCPYCRNITNHILPFIKEEYNVKIYGLNSLNREDIIQEVNIPFYKICKCSVKDCFTYCYSGYQLPFCKTHLSDKTMIRNYKKTAKQQILLDRNMICNVILKMGLRKGEKCGQKCEIGGICKRHKGNVINS